MVIVPGLGRRCPHLAGSPFLLQEMVFGHHTASILVNASKALHTSSVQRHAHDIVAVQPIKDLECPGLGMTPAELGHAEAVKPVPKQLGEYAFPVVKGYRLGGPHGEEGLSVYPEVSRMIAVAVEFIPGSPLNALNIKPEFSRFYFIDLDGDKVEYLRSLVGSQPNVYIFEGDCNKVLLEEVFPRVCYEDYRRGLCLLDPYGLHLNWEVIETAGRLRTIDLFLNFPIMDINRNALWRNPENVPAEGIARMNAFWGDESWRDIAYGKMLTLFGDEEVKLGNEAVAKAFQKRLQEKAGFNHALKPMPMRNTKGAVIYYLYFASQQSVAEKIVMDIFAKYRNRGA